MTNNNKLPKVYMVPEEDAQLIQWYKNVFTDNPILHKTARLAAQQHNALRDPSIPLSVQKSIVREIEPRYHQMRARLQQHETPTAQMDPMLPEDTEEQVTPQEKPIKATTVPTTITKTTRKPPLAQQRLLPALGWEDWEPSGRCPRRGTRVDPKKGRGQRGSKKATG